MADNYLEKHYEDYLKRKSAWEKNRGRSSERRRQSPPPEPDDEAL